MAASLPQRGRAEGIAELTDLAFAAELEAAAQAEPPVERMRELLAEADYRREARAVLRKEELAKKAKAEAQLALYANEAATEAEAVEGIRSRIRALETAESVERKRAASLAAAVRVRRGVSRVGLACSCPRSGRPKRLLLRQMPRRCSKRLRRWCVPYRCIAHVLTRRCMSRLLPSGGRTGGDGVGPGLD